MRYFVKKNHSNFSNSLITEAQGLKALQSHIKKNQIQIKTPQVIDVNKTELILTHIDSYKPSIGLQQRLGVELAKLHNIQQNFCGFETDNYIGLNPQKNIISNNWGEFFWKFRLSYQVNLIKDNSIKHQFKHALDESHIKLVQWLNQNCNHFSLLHGDLWSGNVMYDNKNFRLIDPAPYFGDSETDLAMTEMFGGFSTEFYNSYQYIRPLSNIYTKKRTIYNLYHYINHYNLFGDGYLSACIRGMKTLKNFK